MPLERSTKDTLRQMRGELKLLLRPLSVCSYFSLAISFFPFSFADATKRELEAFFEETFLMKNFCNPNIVGLLGVCLDSEDGFPYIIMSFMSNGNLKEFLKQNRFHLTDISTMPRVSNEICILKVRYFYVEPAPTCDAGDVH